MNTKNETTPAKSGESAPDKSVQQAVDEAKAREAKTESDEEMDLSKFDDMTKKQNEGMDVEIHDPNGKSLGFTIKVSGPDSERQRKAVEKLQNERLETEDPRPLTAEQIAHRQIRGLSMSVMGWTKFKLDGDVYPYNEANAVKLFNRFPFIREQVEAKAGRRAAFLKLSKSDASKLPDAGQKD